MQRTQAIEQTGKKYKLQIMLSGIALLIFGGLALGQLWAEEFSTFIAWGFYISLGWHLGARFFAWWNHG